MANMSSVSTPQYSPEQISNNSKVTNSNTGTSSLFALLNDDNTFTISNETLVKSAAINQTPITNKNSRIVKQTIAHKRSKSLNSRIHSNNNINNIKTLK